MLEAEVWGRAKGVVRGLGGAGEWTKLATGVGLDRIWIASYLPPKA